MADLPGDGPARVRGERHASLGVEALDRLEQAHQPLLNQVVDLLAVGSVPSGDTADEPEVLRHEPLERPGVVVLTDGGDEPGVTGTVTFSV